MGVVPKRLIKAKATNGLKDYYTVPANTISQINDIVLNNDSRSRVMVDIYMGDSDTGKVVSQLVINSKCVAKLSDCKFILSAGEKVFFNAKYSLVLNPNEGSLLINAYGIEEV